ncbi:MAG TPA: rod shape-determining protein [Pyrinomonadaceae bacterium]|nr:rod shape-determining protein [Pyrinomonadaceae bacterium]
MSFLIDMGWDALKNLVSDSMAIDMGSAGTIISVRGRGIVVDEPSVVAVNRVTGEVVAVGREARQMQGREARDVAVIAPLVDGVVADFERTQAMLDRFVRKARSGISHFSRRAVMGVLSGVTQVEQRALLSAAEHAHIRRVFMVEEGLAAAIGAGVPVTDERASAVVDVGGSTTNVAVVANGTIVHANAERIGSSDIEAVITDRLRRYRGLSVGVPTAERLKMELASATAPADPTHSITVKGRDVQTGSPDAIEVTAEEVYGVTQGVLRKIADAVRETLADLPAEVAADLHDRGLILTGGGSLLRGLDQYLGAETRLPVRVADEPRFATVHGLMRLFDEPLLLRRVTRNEPPLIIDSEAGAFES